MTYYFNVAFEDDAGCPEAFRIVIGRDHKISFTHLKFDDVDAFELWVYDGVCPTIQERDSAGSLVYTVDSLLLVTDDAKPVFISMLAQAAAFNGRTKDYSEEATLGYLLDIAGSSVYTSAFDRCGKGFGNGLDPLVLETVVSRGSKMVSRVFRGEDLNRFALPASTVFGQAAVDEFLSDYIAAALFSSTGMGTPDSDSSLQQQGFQADDLDAETRCQMQKDCLSFIQSHWMRIPLDKAHQAGADFWLTRNRHGAGFWDGDWPEADGKALTEASHGYGSLDLFVNDDGKIC
jgi:hypothetical protein